ncbi:MAG: ornithine carbamoyltransferase [Hyphomonadaceae bacterium]
MSSARLSPPPRHFLDLDLIEPAALRAMLDEAHRRKRGRAGDPKAKPDHDAPLAGHMLAAIYEKNSTRTRVSFEMAMRQLGGGVMSLTAADMQIGRGETIEDTARVLSRMVDAVAIRAIAHDTLTNFAAASDIPAINALTDHSHPCQILADLMTLEERGLQLKGARIAWVGDANNVAVSFAHAAAAFGFALKMACPRAYGPAQSLLDEAKRRGAAVDWVDEAGEAAAGADVVVADTWVSMGDTDREARMQALGPYQVDAALMAKAKPSAIFLHCLPAHRGEEVSAEVIDGPQSAVWDEAENRIHAQKAVLLWCLGKL